MLSVETENIIVATQNRIFFARPTKEFDTLFYCNFQQGEKLKPLNSNIINNEDGIIIDQTYHIINNIIQ